MAEKAKVNVLGLDCPPYYVISAVERTLKRNGEDEKAKEFYDRANEVNNIEDIIKIAKEYVEVI
jgi:hypothetical protein